MPSSHALVLIGALAVAMVTAAPLSNQEKFVETSQAGVSVDRAKRAEESIAFGNQQNKPRTMAKKSDLSNLLAPVAPVGEKDKGGEVVALKALPVPPELDARAEAALESSRDKEKLKDELEAAMEQAPVQPLTPQKVVEEVKQEVKEMAKEELNSKEAQKTAEKVAALEEAVDASEVNEGQGDEVDELLNEIQDKDAENGIDLNLNRVDDNSVSSEFYPIMYLNSPDKGYGLASRFPYSLYRKKRDLKRSRRFSTHRGHRAARRIKRDSLSDLYGAYVSEPLAEADEYADLSPEEKEYLYRRLVDNLADLYAEEQGDDFLEEPAEIPYLQEAEETPYSPYEVYGDNRDYNPYLSAGQLEYEPSPAYAKRGMVDYYPLEEVEKRYFFPFSDEPDTHWGAFVPEKRDYNEAIERLQRLALALNDNPGPYYRERIEDYRKK